MKMIICDKEGCEARVIGRSSASLRIRHSSPIGNIFDKVSELDLCNLHAIELEKHIVALLGAEVFTVET